jgi:hypothetical protein
VAESYNNLGTAFWAQRDKQKAVEFFEKSLAVSVKVLGANHPRTEQVGLID